MKYLLKFKSYYEEIDWVENESVWSDYSDLIWKFNFRLIDVEYRFNLLTTSLNWRKCKCNLSSFEHMSILRHYEECFRSAWEFWWIPKIYGLRKPVQRNLFREFSPQIIKIIMRAWVHNKILRMEYVVWGTFSEGVMVFYVPKGIHSSKKVHMFLERKLVAMMIWLKASKVNFLRRKA